MDRERARRLLRAASELGLYDPAEPGRARGEDAPERELERLLAERHLSAATLRDLEQELDARAPSAAPAPGEPDPVEVGGGDYELGALLGEGASGRVYRAVDQRLERVVAIKLLANQRPDGARRLLREARAQARIDHPHLCRVYGVGEMNGRPFIAMQFVDGPTLAQAAPSLSVRERVTVVRDAARALDAAHERGLIHRDLKPGNILIERRAGGAPHAFVTDFGLARDVEAEHATITDGVAGTPPFMSPEQVRGEPALDRRSDVYGLGATLYAVLALAPPFTGVVAHVLHAVLNEEPAPLPAEIPRPLATLVRACMAKDPALRPESAGALADELDRWLRGEPIRAQPEPWWRRARRVLARRRGVVLAGIVLVAAFAVGGGGLWLSRRDSLRRLAAAQRFGETVAAVEARMHQIELMPLHDLVAERAALERQVAGVEAQMAELGVEGRRAGEAAVGRALLAIGRLEEARRHLQAAWDEGLRTPEVAEALGRALGALYRRGLADLERLDDQADRDARRAELDAALRTPAVAALKAATQSGALPSSQSAGLLALYEGRADDAVAAARAVLAEQPDALEALELGAEAELLSGNQAASRADHPRALAAFDRAGAHLARALEIARSKTSLYRGDCERLIAVARANSRLGRVPDGIAERALGRCDQALTADRDDADALELEATAWSLIAGSRQGRSLDPSDAIARVLAAARRAAALRPAEPGFASTLGEALLARAKAERARGTDPRPTIEQASEALERAMALAPRRVRLRYLLGQLHEVGADYAEQHGLDPAPSRERAQAAYLRGLELAPDHPELLTALGSVLLAEAVAAHDSGRPWRELSQRAVDALGRAIARGEGASDVVTLLGFAWNKRAEELLDDGEDPDACVAAALATARGAEGAHPRDPVLRLVEALALSLRATAVSARGGDPRADLDEADRVAAHAVTLAGDDFEIIYDSALIALRAADVLGPRDARAARAAAARGRAALVRARRLNPTDPDIADAQSRVELADALLGGPGAAAALARAEEFFERVRSGRPRLDYYQVETAARLARLRAELLLARPAGGAESAKALDAALTRARDAVHDGLALAPRSLKLAEEQGRVALLDAQQAGGKLDAARAAGAAGSLARVAAADAARRSALAPLVERARSLAAARRD